MDDDVKREASAVTRVSSVLRLRSTVDVEDKTQADWLKGQPAFTADDAEIAGWFREKPMTDDVVIADPATNSWLKGQPAFTAADPKIAGWFRGKPKTADAAIAEACRTEI